MADMTKMMQQYITEQIDIPACRSSCRNLYTLSLKPQVMSFVIRGKCIRYIG